MKTHFIFLILIIGLVFASNLTYAQDIIEETPIPTAPNQEITQPIIGYLPTSFSEIFTDPEKYDKKQMGVYGYYDKTTNLLKENPDANTGLTIKLQTNCYDSGATNKSCPEALKNNEAVTAFGIFSAENYELQVKFIETGQIEGSKCTSKDECKSRSCLFTPKMKMILPKLAYPLHQDLPANAKEINFSIDVGPDLPTPYFIVVVIDPAPDTYGYCTGSSFGDVASRTLPEELVREAFIENGVLEENEPFILRSGYSIGTWNNNKYSTTSFTPGREKYLDWIKEALTEVVPEEYFNKHIKLVSFNNNQPRIYPAEAEEISAEFIYIIGDYNFHIYYNLETHQFTNNEWVEIDKETFKSKALEQKIKPIESEKLMTKEAAFEKLKTECAPSLSLLPKPGLQIECGPIPQQPGIYLLEDGTIALYAHELTANISQKPKIGQIDMQTGQILKCEETETTPASITGTIAPEKSGCGILPIMATPILFEGQTTQVFASLPIDQTLFAGIIIVVVAVLAFLLLKIRKKQKN